MAVNDTLPIPLSFQVIDVYDNVERPDGRNSHWEFVQVRMCVKRHYGQDYDHFNYWYTDRHGNHIPRGSEVIFVQTYSKLRAVAPDHHLLNR